MRATQTGLAQHACSAARPASSSRAAKRSSAASSVSSCMIASALHPGRRCGRPRSTGVTTPRAFGIPVLMSVSKELADLLDERLASADEQLRRDYPGDGGGRQPVHTVYVPADRFTADVPRDWGRAALEQLDRYAPTAAALAAATGLP